MPACFVGCQEQQELYKASKVLRRPSVREADRHILSSLHHGKPGYNLVTGSTIDFGVTWPLSLWRHSSVDPFSRPAKQQFSYRSCKSVWNGRVKSRAVALVTNQRERSIIAFFNLHLQNCSQWDH